MDTSTMIDQQVSQQTDKPVPSYTINPNQLEVVFDNVLHSIGPKSVQERITTSDPVGIITQIVQLIMSGENMPGCKFYTESIRNSVVDPNYSTVMVSSFLSLKHLGLDSKDAKTVVLSHQMRSRLADLFDAVSSQSFKSDQPSKVLLFKLQKENPEQPDDTKRKLLLPAFVKKNPTQYVYLKAIMRVPKVPKN